VLLRANIPTAVVATLVNTPPTFGPVYYAAWKVGATVLGEPVSDKNKPEVLADKPDAVQTPSESISGWSKWAATLQQVGEPLLLGAAIFSVVFSALAYVMVNGIWHWRVRRKRQRRLRARQDSAG
jgi:uncharacterized protein (DUF2062 family)